MSPRFSEPSRLQRFWFCPRMARRVHADVIYDETVAGLGSLSGRTCAITGTTSGTGYWTAIAAHSAGSRILLLNRPSAAERALAEIRRAGSADVAHVDCDLQRFERARGGGGGRRGQRGARRARRARVQRGRDGRARRAHPGRVRRAGAGQPLVALLAHQAAHAVARGGRDARARGARRAALERRAQAKQAEAGIGRPRGRVLRAASAGGARRRRRRRVLRALSPDQTREHGVRHRAALQARRGAARGSRACAPSRESRAPRCRGTRRRRRRGSIGASSRPSGSAMTSCSGGHVQSAADGACPLIVAAFDARTGSGDLWMPSTHSREESECARHARQVHRGRQADGHAPVDRREVRHEALTLSLENQATVLGRIRKRRRGDRGPCRGPRVHARVRRVSIPTPPAWRTHPSPATARVRPSSSMRCAPGRRAFCSPLALQLRMELSEVWARPFPGPTARSVLMPPREEDGADRQGQDPEDDQDSDEQAAPSPALGAPLSGVSEVGWNVTVGTGLGPRDMVGAGLGGCE